MPRPDDEFDDRDDRSHRDARDDRDDRSRRDARDDRDEAPPRPRKRGMSTGAILLIVGVIVVVCGGGLVGGGIYAVVSMRDSANRMKSSNNMKQMALAIHNYNDVNGELPSNTFSPDGKPLLSWRVHLLPYIEQDNLYRQFKLNEPWDSPNNVRLLDQMPMIYSRPGTPRGQSGTTYYRGFSSPGAVFERRIVLDQPRPKKDHLSIADFNDGSSHTILVVEAGDPVEWSRPDDLDASPGKPFPKMGGHNWRDGGFNVMIGDGSIRKMKADTPETTLRALITHSGGEPRVTFED